MKNHIYLKLALAITLAMAGFTHISYAASFPDVPENTVYYAPVEYLKAKGIVVGYPDGTFRTDQTIKRDEALKIVMMASGINTESTQEINFTDVSSADWSYQYIRKAVQRGIVEGYQDGTFRPANPINVAESSKIIPLAFAIDPGPAPTTNPYPDVPADAWHARYIQYLKKMGLLGPQGDGLFHAERDITRGEFAQIIYRLMYVEEKNLETFPLSTDWPVFEDNCLGYRLKYPFYWETLQATDGTRIFWKPDTRNMQQSWARLTPNSAVVAIIIDPNEQQLDIKDYLGGHVYTQGADVTEQTLNSYPFAAVVFTGTGMTDYYFELPNKKILIAYTQLGIGPYASYLAEEIRYLVGSIRDKEVSSDVNCSSSTGGSGGSVTTQEELLSQLNSHVLMEGQGQKALDLMSDLLLLETDTIGIGTGPVDYYYSPAYDVTLKYERNSKTLLAVQKGKTTAF